MTLARAIRSKSGAFTLVELIVVIVVLAILSGVAIPKYFDYTTKAKESSCKGVLGGVRSAIANFYSNQSVQNSGTGSFPTLTDMQTVGSVMQEPMPANPYNGSAVVAAATYSSSAPPVSGSNGWNYDAASGKFWANSNTTGVGENAW